jgi:hypothetical protein
MAHSNRFCFSGFIWCFHRSLQEQTDRALADSQGQLVQVEMELSNAQERVRQLEKDRAGLDRDVVNLKNEVSVMRSSLAQVDQEKDGLLVRKQYIYLMKINFFYYSCLLLYS